MGWSGFGWRPYVPVARRRASAASAAAKIAKKENRTLAPVAVEGRAIARSFWGQAWCENMEAYSDYANRLPRGRTYVRNGSVVDLQIKRGKIEALVSGSELYKVAISIVTLAPAAWTRIKQDCSQSISSLIDLLQGRFDQAIMQRLSRRDGGLFPQPKEIKLSCSCPDYAGLCKHVAAVLYGVGVRLDTAPELLFTLRNVDHLELISQAVTEENLGQTFASQTDSALAGSDLGELFGIDLDVTTSQPKKIGRTKRKAAQTPAEPAAPTGRRAARPRKSAQPTKPSAKSVNERILATNKAKRKAR